MPKFLPFRRLATTEATLAEWERRLNHLFSRMSTETNYVTVDNADLSLTIGDIATMTSAELAGRITDETGTGVAVFGTSPTFTTQITTPKVASTDDLTIDCGTEKTLVLADVVYDDLQFPVEMGKIPTSSEPNWEAFTANTGEYAFSVNEYIDVGANEIPHWWKEGTTAEAHLHITTKAANTTGSNRFAKFSVVVAYADANEAWVEQAALTAEYTIPTGTAALTALYLSMGTVTLTNYKIGAQIKARIKRIAATGGTEYSGDIFITQLGIHLQKDTMGSRTVSTK